MFAWYDTAICKEVNVGLINQAGLNHVLWLVFSDLKPHDIKFWKFLWRMQENLETDFYLKTFKDSIDTIWRQIRLGIHLFTSSACVV